MLTILFVYKQRSDPAPTKERWLRLRNTGQGAWGPEPNSKLKIVPSGRKIHSSCYLKDISMFEPKML